MSDKANSARNNKKVTDKKVPTSLIDEVSQSLELKPADVRKYLLRMFEVATDMAENKEADSATRFAAMKQVDSMYVTLMMKEAVDEHTLVAHKLDRTNNRTLDEVKRLRNRPYDDQDAS